MQIKKDLTSFLKSAKKPLIVILGPTASGKTGLSIKIAKEIGGEIISTDSRQIYKEMDIGTDSVLPEDQEGVPHHMLGITTPDKPISLADYRDMALKIIEEIYERGAIPILAGGTGLYISAIIENYELPRSEPDTKLREKLEKSAKEKGAEYLHDMLKKMDPNAAQSIHPNNVRYVIRAMEINKLTGANKPDRASGSDFDLFMIGINHPREKLYENVEKRVENQLKRGLIYEVKQLIGKGYDRNLPAMSSLGVKEIIPYIVGDRSMDECKKTLKRNTRRYAKRQMTWFRRYDNINWLQEGELLNY